MQQMRGLLSGVEVEQAKGEISPTNRVSSCYIKNPGIYTDHRGESFSQDIFRKYSDIYRLIEYILTLY